MNDQPTPEMRDALPMLDVLGLPVLALPWGEALEAFESMILHRDFHRVAWLNAHCSNVAVNNGAYREALRRFLLLPDGVGVDLAAIVRHGRPFPDNLNGTDFVPDLLRHVTQPLRVALIGAQQGVAELAAAALARHAPQHEVRALAHGFFTSAEESDILARLASWQPDILLVAMGVPRQELFIGNRIDASHCTLAFAVGALFDFQAGTIQRAPALVRSLRLEWMYRLSREPARLWRRYLLGNPNFIFRILRDWLARRNRLKG